MIKFQFHNDLSGREFIDTSDWKGWTKGDFYEDVPRRLYVNFYWREKQMWGVVLGSRTQGWSPFRGYRGFMSKHWWPIVVSPGVDNRCGTPHCGLRRKHRGKHF